MAIRFAYRFNSAVDAGDGTADRQFRLYDVTGTPINRISPTPLALGTVDLVQGPMLFSPDSDRLALGSDNSPYLEIYRVSDWVQLTPLPSMPANPVKALAWSNDGTLLAAASNFETKIYNVITKTLVRTISPPSNTQRVAFSPDGTLIFIALLADEWRIYNVATGALVKSRLTGSGGGSDPTNIIVSPSGNIVCVTYSGAPYINFFTVAGSSPGDALAGLPGPTPTTSVRGVGWSADGQYFLATAAYYDEDVQVYNVNGNQDNPAGYVAETMQATISNSYEAIETNVHQRQGWPTFAPHELAVSVVMKKVGVSQYAGVYLRKISGTWTLVSTSDGSTDITNTLGSTISGISMYDTAAVTAFGDTVTGSFSDSMAIADLAEGEGITPANIGNVFEDMDAEDEFASLVLQLLRDAVGIEDSNFSQAVYVLMERFGVSESVLASQVLNVSVVEALAGLDRFRPILVGLLQELAAIDDQGTLTLQRIAAVIESMASSDGVTSRMTALALVALAMSLGDRLLHLTLAQVQDLVESDDTFAAKLVANVVLAEVIDLSAALIAGRALLLGISDAAGFADQNDPFASIRAALSEGVEVEAELILFGEVYQGWTLNTESGAPTEYQNYPFNSMAKLGQRYYGAAEDGLFLLDGDTDDGDPIRARILTGEMDFDSPNLKRIERAYMGYTTRGDLVLKVIATHAGVQTEYWYKAAALTNGERTESRVKIGEGIVSRYWQFELVNSGGADFEIDRWDIDVRDLKRRV